jgi:quinol-cytochrome oxidoreductase complex cytochrome b subunit
MEKYYEKVPRDRLLFKEFITSLIALAVLSWASLLFTAPLSAPGGELTPAGVAVKAPWIFVGLQVLLQYISPIWGGMVLPLAAVAFLVLLPLEERLPVSSHRVSTFLFILLLISAIALTLYGFLR